MVTIILGIVALTVSVIFSYILIGANIDNTINLQSRVDIVFTVIVTLSALVTPVYILITLIEKIW